MVVVGAGGAGGTAAATLRQEGFDGPVVLVGAESQPPYERPPLSKAYLQGRSGVDALWLRPEGFWEEQAIELRLGVEATSLDPASRTLGLSDGGELTYQRLLLATGGRNRRPPIPGLGLAGVCDLRFLADADAVRARADGAARAVVVGLGFIGCEVAASLRALGLEVTAVDPQPAPLAQVLGEEVGAAVAQLHRDHGVELLLGDAVDHVDGDDHLEAVVTREGRRLPCDVAVVGLGIAPATGLAEAAGLAVDDGVVVDDRCRTSAEGVYAAGDVARHHHPLFGRHVRVEHWMNALEQGQAAALSMLDVGEPYQDVPWFWSDQYDTTIQYAGIASRWDRLVLRGDAAARRFSAFYLADGRLQAAAGVNQPRDVRAAMRLIAAGGEVDPDRLADEDTDLRQLAREVADGG
jgi:3-phenylpropionate/trans-cinnamate dioxygenase ferredoxin reductase subunit